MAPAYPLPFCVSMKPDDDLYDHRSMAHHRALEKLECTLREIGFLVVTKIPREMTLRVYPTKIGQYPLLNPRFWERDSLCQEGSLRFSVFSQGDKVTRGEMPSHRDGLHRYLKTFHKTPGCSFSARGELRGDYYWHGNFILPLPFTAAEIDLPVLNAPLADLLRFLQALSF
jgi:hypothetical protein